MEKIYERKPEAGPSLYRPQKSGHLHDNQGVERKTRKMARIPQPIQLQNYIPTRKGGKETRRPHQKARGHTHNRRKETRKKNGDPTAKRNLLGNTRRTRSQDRGNRASRISGQGQRKNSTSIQQGRRNPSHQKELGKRNQGNERNS